MTVQLLTKHHLEFLSLKGGCTGSYESTLVKMPCCWKSDVAVHMPLAVVRMLNTNTQHTTSRMSISRSVSKASLALHVGSGIFGKKSALSNVEGVT